MMRKECLLLVLALTGPGCLSSGTHVEKESRQAPPVRMVETPPPAVTADQISEANAVDKAQALAREIDYDAGIRPAMPPMATTTASLTIP
ncbi:MAG TPA: hypothetical protein VMG10_24920 [Gemmataceae bacterium]|nr:hypothetical protein [Gemmataceae bacterium]